MVSQTIAQLLQEHQANAHLNSNIPNQTVRDDKDLGTDGRTAPLDEQIIARVAQALDDGQTHYVPVPGINPLREAIAELLNQQTQSGYSDANVVITAGVQESRFLTIQKMSEEFGNQLALPSVVHPGVLKTIGIRSRTLTTIPVETQQSALPSVAAVEQAMADGNRLLYLESPSRLTGERYSAADVAQIAQAGRQHNATVIWDQGLAPWVDAGQYHSLASHDSDQGNVAVIGEIMPGSGLSSWFIGYIAAPVAYVPAMQSQKQIMSICTGTPAQYAALQATELTQAQQAQQHRLRDQRNQLVNLAQQANLDVIEGQAANVLAVRVGDNKASVLNTLAQGGYLVADGSDFGADDIIRFNVNPTTQAALELLA